ncbi:MAG: hypothetical protein ACUVXA_04010 [Candidatus Jordarchaeum sp.]|uniref:hypothetical protein n=1 Tax=Candidatus Jordarchaeum sp. TaxID=2823881 RepID=UPI004049C11B
MSSLGETEERKKLLEIIKGLRGRSISILNYILESQKGSPVASAKIQEDLELTPSNLSHGGKILEDAKMIIREKEGYTPNMGFLLAAILDIVLDLEKRVKSIEDEMKKK